MKLEFSRQIFEKYSNIKFHENLFSAIRVVPFRQTEDRRNEILQTCLKTPQRLDLAI